MRGDFFPARPGPTTQGESGDRREEGDKIPKYGIFLCINTDF